MSITPYHPRPNTDVAVRLASGAHPGPGSAERPTSQDGWAQDGALVRCPRAGHEKRGALTMATDYDQPRRSEADDLGEDSLEELKARRAEAQASSVDVDEADLAEALELPGADLSGEELTVRVLPKQSDEFTCSSCFLVHHRSQLASDKGGRLICRECA